MKFINLVTLSGLVGLGPALMAGRARFEHFATPFVADGNARNPYPHPRWDFPEARRSAQYSQYSLPKAPVFHAYDIGDVLRDPDECPKFTYNIMFPKAFFEAIPDSVKAGIAQWGPELPGDRVDMFCVIQNQPSPAAVPMLFRPHYWTDPDAPDFGRYARTSQVQVGLFESQPGIQFRNHAGEFFMEKISVHPKPELKNLIASSPNNLFIDGLDFNRSTSFWTLVREGQRAAATLHILLNDRDQAILEALAPRLDSLGKLVRGLEGSPLAGARWVEQLKQMTRPIITQRNLEPAAGGGLCALSLLGSGFTGATQVRLDGVPVSGLRVMDDGLILVAVPAGRAETKDVQVITPMGASSTPGRLVVPADAATPAAVLEAGAGLPNLWDLNPPASGGPALPGRSSLSVPATGVHVNDFRIPALPAAAPGVRGHRSHVPRQDPGPGADRHQDAARRGQAGPPCRRLALQRHRRL